ncbi:phosphoglycerate dehydrogenase [Halarchaeum grantii]|uniref:Phosphoglycerate dehydrogenase n=1 Tax=Halarchaeum grantii TaxID=1193105 RepID=A0A830FBT6_9EURY|nr:D-2-hydroxyacid dehydrogenase [Halarchaeum grantii]GGL38887.1 phosphoglycerate dehydrogenase [Halarchaeum grantii]
MSEHTVLVLREGTHGMPMSEYAAAIRERRPDDDVVLARTRDEERELIADADVVTGGGLGRDLLERADGLALFAAISAGYEHLPLDDITARGAVVTNASGVHVPNMAEQVLGNLLVFARRLDEGWRRQQVPRWEHYQAGELKDSTVTVVGLGAIGQGIVARLEPFGVETVGVRYSPEKGGPTDEVVGFDGPGFEAALARTDYLVLACPLTDTTEGLVDDAAFGTLPPDAVLVNVARGGVVETDALLRALRKNELRGAALDVTDPEPLPEDHPLWAFENVHVTPHMAGSTPEYYERCADILARNLERVDETGDYAGLENAVAEPE